MKKPAYVPTAEDHEAEEAKQYVLQTYPKAVPQPLGPAMGKGWWIVTGTGYTLNHGRTLNAAWINSAHLVRTLSERAEWAS